MKAFIKILGIVLIFGLVFGFTGNQPAMAADGPVCNTNSGLCYTTIQAAITAATEGDTITIANGTYNEALNIDRSLTLDGESEAGVIINTGSFADYGIDAGGDITTYFRDFTLIGSPSSGSTISTYGFKVSGENAFTTIEHVTVQGYGRSGIDLNGLAGGTVNDVTVSGSLDGVGLALTDSSNIAVSNVTTSGNAWAGMAIFTKGASYVGGSSGVTLSGTNSFAEPVDFYIQEENGYAVTGFTQSDFGFTFENPVDRLGYTFYFVTQAEAIEAALSLLLTTPSASVVTDLNSDSFLVVPGMSIQAAHDAADPGDTIIVADGTYTIATEPAAPVGLVNIYKQITIKAAEDGNSVRPVIDATGRDGVFKIHANALTGGQVVIEGFDITGDKPLTGTAITIMYCGGDPATEVIIRDNLIHGMIAGVNPWTSSNHCPAGTDYVMTGLEISGNQFYDLGYTGVKRGFGIAFESLSDWAEAGNDYSAIITGNSFADIYSASPDLTGLGAAIAFVGGSANAQVTGNIFTGDIAVDVALQGADAATTLIEDNAFTTAAYGVAAVSITGGPVDASPNYWGTTAPTLIQGKIMGDVSFDPYWVNAEMTILSSTAPAVVYVDDNYTAAACGGHLCGYDAFSTIQEGVSKVATGGTVNVAAGLYDERVEVTRKMTLLGATHGVSKKNFTPPSAPDYAYDTAAQTVIRPTADLDVSVLKITADEVVVDGFVIANTSIITAGNMKNLVEFTHTYAFPVGSKIINSVVGPLTGPAQNGNLGRFGIVVPGPSSTTATKTRVFTISDNYIFDCLGNGGGIGIIGAGDSGVEINTGTEITNNTITGHHRSGIEIAGMISGTAENPVLIANNTITNNGGFAAADAANLKYGNGITFIRIGSDRTNGAPYGVPKYVKILNNVIEDNEKNGIYLGPIVENITIEGNSIKNNGTMDGYQDWDGIRIDLIEAYYSATDPAITSYLKNIVILKNSILGNGALGINSLGGTPDSGNTDASANWWGTAFLSLITPEVSGPVTFTPYYIDAAMTTLSEPLPDEVWVDDDFTTTSCGGHFCGYDAFTTVQDGIAGVAAGGTVNIAAGTYTENPVVSNKQISFLGEVDGSGEALPVIKGMLSIDLPGTDNNWSIQNLNFEVFGSITDSISMKNVNGVTVRNCNFNAGGESAARAINLVSGPNGNTNLVFDNVSITNGYYIGISGYMNGITVRNSTMAGIKSGINLQGGGGNLVIEDTDIAVVARGVSSDTYGVRFASSGTTINASNFTFTGGSISVDKNGLVANSGIFHSTIIIRSGAGGTLQIEGADINGEVVNQSTTLILDASPNWWMDAAGPADGWIRELPGDIVYNPWYNNAAMTTKTYYVCSDQPYTTIQSAIDAAAPGDTVLVCPGTYNEHLLITKQLTVKGENKAATIIDGGATGIVVTIQGTSGVVFSGFTVQNSGTDLNAGGGIGLILTTNSVIEDNIIQDNASGVGLLGSSGNIVRNNTIDGSARYGIVADQVPDQPTLVSPNNTITGNIITDSGRDGIYVGKGSHGQTVTNNTISGATGTTEGTVFEGNGIYFWKSINNTVTGNTIFNNVRYGIELMGSRGNTINSNTIYNNLDGIRVRSGVDPDYLFGPVSIGDNIYEVGSVQNTQYNIVYEVPRTWETLQPLPATFQAILDEAPYGATILVPGSTGVYTQPEAFKITRPGLTIILEDGVTIQNDTASCFNIQAAHTHIISESKLGAKCVPTGGWPGIMVNFMPEPWDQPVEDIVIRNLEIDGTGQDTGTGIWFAYFISNVQVIDNYIHDLDAEIMLFEEDIAGVFDFQGNLFKNIPIGIADLGSHIINPDPLNFQYNSWGSYEVTTEIANSGFSEVDFEPWTHVDLYVKSSGIVGVGEMVTFTVYGNMKNVYSADFTLDYPEGMLELLSFTNLSGFVPAGPQMFVVDDTAGTINFNGILPIGGTPVSGADLPIFKAVFRMTSEGEAVMDLMEENDTFAMNPGYGPSTNIYASELKDGMVTSENYTVTGTISMQGRVIRSGTPVTLNGLISYGPYTAISTNIVGINLTFTNVAEETYLITTLQPRYLNVTADLNKTIVVDGNEVIKPLELKGGNANWSDNVIDVNDASTVGFNYKKVSFFADADVNFDNKVDILDLTLVGGNFDLTSAKAYETWVP